MDFNKEMTMPSLTSIPNTTLFTKIKLDKHSISIYNLNHISLPFDDSIIVLVVSVSIPDQ